MCLFFFVRKFCVVVVVVNVFLCAEDFVFLVVLVVDVVIYVIRFVLALLRLVCAGVDI